jgi:hypothetical protein
MATRAAALSAASSERVFFGGMALAMLATVFAGFARSYYLGPWFGAPSLSTLVHLHGIVASAWMLLFIGQTTLIAARRPDLHRLAGYAGLVLAAALIAVSVLAAVEAGGVSRRFSQMPPHVFIVFPLGLAFMFAALVTAAALLRRRPAFHKRLMLIATIAILAPAIARLQLPFLPRGPVGANIGAWFFLAPLAVHDLRTLRHIHPATLAGGGFLIAMLPLRLALAETSAWKGFVNVLVG